MKIKRKDSLNLLKTSFVLAMMILLWNCEKEEYLEQEKKDFKITNVSTVSFQEAMKYFETEKQNIKDQFFRGKNTEEKIELTPDWNTLQHSEIAYTEALLTTAKTEVNRQGKYYSKLFFVNINGYTRNVIFTTFVKQADINGNIIDASVFFNKVNGDYIDGYRIENGKFTKRYVPQKDEVQKASLFSLLLLIQSTEGDDTFWCNTTGNLEPVDLGTIVFTTPGSHSGGGPGYSDSYLFYNTIGLNSGTLGDYVNGATGNGTSFSGGGGVTNNSLSVGQVNSAAGAILAATPVDPDENGKCPEGYVKNTTTGKCDPICKGGKVYDTTTKTCNCPEGKKDDGNGNCVDDCDTTKEDLKKIYPSTSEAKLKEIADAINTYGRDFGIDNKDKLRHFLAQAGHESAKMTAFEENLNYRWKKLGIDYWKGYFNPHTDGDKDSKKVDPNDYKRSTTSVYVNKEKFANYVYNDANRGNGYKLGNTSTGDGYKYRGRGIIQLTGKSNYESFNTFYQGEYDSNKDLVSDPSPLKTDMKIAVISALWFFKNNVLDKITVNGTTSVKSVTKKVNGGTNGLKDRKELYNKAKTNIDCKKTKIMKHLKATFLIVFLLTLASFTILKVSENDKELIIGTWIPEGCSECKWVFTNQGKLYDYYQGNIDSTYDYSISEFTATNGVVFSHLKITNVNNLLDTYEYDINGISDGEMYLDYLGDMSAKLSKYTKEQ